MTSGPPPPEMPEIDTSVSHPARIWNYWLGGNDYFRVDKEVGDQILGSYRNWSGRPAPIAGSSPGPSGT